MELVVLLVFLVYSPICALLITIVLLLVVGVSGLFGMIIISLLVPIQTRINRLNNKLRGIVGAKADIRTKRVTEIIDGIRLLKMNGW